MARKHLIRPGLSPLESSLRVNPKVSKLIQYARLSPDHPERPVNWRWQLALSKLDTGATYLKDSLVYLAYKFLKKLKYLQALDGTDFELGKDLNELCIAWDIYTAPKNARRAELEARLLANEVFTDISKKMFIPERTIVLYEAIFFNVFDRLDSPSYIINHAIGNIYDVEIIDEYAFWKLVGYWCGVDSIELIIYDKPPKLVGDDINKDEVIVEVLRNKIIQNLQRIKIKSSEELNAAIQSYTKIQQIMLGGMGSQTQKDFIEAVRSAMSSINWSPSSVGNYIDVEYGSIDNYIEKNDSLPLIEEK